MRRLSAVIALVLVAAFASADMVVLTNGDRVTGKVVGSVARRVRLQTPYGVLVIPAEKVDRIERDDGTEQVLRPAPAPTPPAPAPTPPGLLLVVSGASFWHAWDPKAAPEDPSLRLEIRVDDSVVASYTDVNLDPEDLPKAIVNSFVFSPERLFVSSGEGVSAAPPSLVESEIRLEIRLPPRIAGLRQLRIAYQLNDAGSAAPRWRDVVVADLAVTLEAGQRANVRVQQDRGTMEYGRKGLRALGQMRGVDTFRATLEAQPAS
ncbi:MAG TPA: hypothetical protein VIJ10_11930 [Vicinamibacteria bacterium]|jgi:hypothetical protein